MSKFVHLHTHSHYSLLDGLAKIPDLVSCAKELGMDTLALTDHGVMYGAIEFYKECLKEDLKPIIGVEAYVAPRGMKDKEGKIDANPYHLILLAENEKGYQNLLKLVSLSHLEGFYYKPRVDKETLAKYAEGIIASSACLAGEIPYLAVTQNAKAAEKALLEYLEIFGKQNFFLEVQSNPELEKQKIANDIVVELAKKHQVGLIATNDVHYLNKDDAEAQDVLLCVQTGKFVSDTDRMSMKENGKFLNISMRSPEEMIKEFAYLPEAIENTVQVAKRCTTKIELGRFIFPKLEIENGSTPEEELKKICYNNLKVKYPEATPEIKERLDFELQTIDKMGFANYMLVVSDYTNFAKTRGISTNTRGSAAGSIVSYLTGITDVEPLQYGLLFERFLNPERISWPDVDLDISDRRREELIRYVTEKYGADKVAQIITFGTIAARNGIRDTGRVLSMSYTDVDKIAKLIPMGLTLNESLEIVDELKTSYQKDPVIKKLFDLAKKIEGVARHASVHAAGVVITDKPLTEYVPLQMATKGEQSIVTQYEMHALEDLGLVKMDFLGLANLTIIDDTLRIIRKTKKEEVDINHIPLDDPETYKLLSAGKSSGVFQLECLSGETIVSNTTIKKLYEKRNKTRLQSIYLDEGKVHKNQIIDVLKGEKKDLYALITENNWHIKASKDHYFLTKNGWKKLGDIQIGEEVLTKEHAKHLVFNTCESCHKQIDGQKEGKSKFCYQCSASFYKNPSKKTSREKIRKARIEFYQQGGKPWNYGLTIETNDILKKTGQKISRALAGRSLEDLWGKEKAEKFKKAHSERNKGSNNPMFGRTPPHRKGGFRSDLGHYVRSSWEADFARILQFHRINYQYEPKTFHLIKNNGEVLNYTPDFYVPSENTFYEIKGWLHNLDAEKIKLFQEQYPQNNFVIISATKFAEFALKYKTLIKWECPKIPTKPSFKFIKVKEIKYSGQEETYDIAMKAPGNNFVANGFLVHNSDGMKRYLKELRPNNIKDVMAMVSLYRPGPMELIPQYIAGKHGRREITYLHPKLEPILAETYGVAVYQEQILQIAQDICGFSLGQADILRKAIGKKIKKLLMEQKEKWVEGAIKEGTSRKIAEKLFEFVEPFARYGFNKAHAASYALVAYKTAYLKAHYPSEFMAAWMTSEEGRDIEKITFALNEAQNMGIKVLPPNVNESFVDFGVIPETGDISYALASIKNVGRGAAEAMVEERKQNGRFEDFESFLKRLGSKILNKKIIEALTKTGALDQFAERNEILLNIENILKFLTGTSKETATNQMGLFGQTNNKEIAQQLKLEPTEPAPKKQKLSWEKELLGMYVSEHPLKGMEKSLKTFANPINQITPTEGKSVKVAGIITTISKILTRSKESMLFATVEDTSARTEVLVFPKVLQKDALVWQTNNIVLVEGRTNTKDGALKIIAQSVKEITLTPITPDKDQLEITLPRNAKKDILFQIKTILESFPGITPVILKAPQNGGFAEIKTKTKVEKTTELIKQLEELLNEGSIE
ncbi:MAG: DNA polymerase III subunit alpha [Patescibacteria group bacterium]|nr:DNA polymerase III subunit alpha [Patescibacteria group bacterium]